MYITEPSFCVFVTKCNSVSFEPPISLYTRTYIISNKNKIIKVSYHDYLRERHLQGQLTLTRPQTSPTANPKVREQNSNADTVPFAPVDLMPFTFHSHKKRKIGFLKLFSSTLSNEYYEFHNIKTVYGDLTKTATAYQPQDL